MRPKPENAGPDMDAWVARHVLGWEPVVIAGPGLYWSRPDGSLGSLPAFSTNKDDAETLRTLMAEKGYNLPRRRSPLAVCQAAVDAVAQGEAYWKKLTVAAEPEPQPIAELAPDEPVE